jgi:hypothetical protein
MVLQLGLLPPGHCMLGDSYHATSQRRLVIQVLGGYGQRNTLTARQPPDCADNVSPLLTGYGYSLHDCNATRR